LETVFSRPSHTIGGDHVAGGRNYRVCLLLVNASSSGAEGSPSSKLWRRFAGGVNALGALVNWLRSWLHRRRTWSGLRRSVSRPLMN